MSPIQIITPVARFYIDRSLFTDAASVQSWVDRYAAQNPDHDVEVQVEENIYYGHGPVGIVPAIWTHTPVPLGMAIEAIHAQFEARAASVLSDYEEPTNLASDPSYHDGRYKDTTVRAAWMMYLDLAIEHYLTPL